MRNDEFKTLLTAVHNALTVEEIDALETKPMTERQIDKLLEARRNRIAELEDWEIFKNHMNCTDCIDDTPVDDNEPKFINEAPVEKGTNEMSKNEEVKTEATETTTPAVITDAEPAPADVKKLEAAVNRVQKKIDKIAKSYIEIIGDVALLYEDKNFKALGYKNIYDLAKDKFGMSRGTVNNLLSVYARFGENYKLKDEYKDMSLRELLDHIHKEKAAQRTLEIGEEAELEEVTDGDGEEVTDGNGGKKGKKETLVKFDFDTIDSWTIDELIEKFREELGDTFTIPANAHINFVVTE